MNALIKQSRAIARAIMVGCYVLDKYRNQAVCTDTLRTAKCLRKQGVSCETALLILAYK